MVDPELRCQAAPIPAAKRVCDLLAVGALAPLLCLVAACLLVLNPVFNPGPLLFTQVRTGRGGASFRMFKFRSMVGTARAPAFAPAEARRISRLGALIRLAHLDELPQLINVLRGEMSLVGPRPEQVYFARAYARLLPRYRLRHSVLPGITGRAQVLQGYAASESQAQQKLRHDLAYIEDRGAFRDLRVCLASAVLLCAGRAWAAHVLVWRPARALEVVISR
ncbi:MAG: sugar transferase [Pseudomonadota bacterium]